MQSHEILSKKWDYAVSNMIVKTTVGASVGLVFSMVLKRRIWPIAFGLGVGMGIAYGESLSTFNYEQNISK